jgi:hypothetical protein
MDIVQEEEFLEGECRTDSEPLNRTAMVLRVKEELLLKVIRKMKFHHSLRRKMQLKKGMNPKTLEEVENSLVVEES